MEKQTKQVTYRSAIYTIVTPDEVKGVRPCPQGYVMVRHADGRLMRLPESECAPVETVAPQTRLEVIEGDLNAYRQGWISWDLANVRELQAERTRILTSDAYKNK
jgi:hypothetical protein